MGERALLCPNNQPRVGTIDQNLNRNNDNYVRHIISVTILQAMIIVLYTQGRSILINIGRVVTHNNFCLNL